MRALTLLYLYLMALMGAIINVNRGPTTGARMIRSFALGSPALGTAAAVLAATATASGSTVTTGITNPDVARNVTATPGGTTANVTAVSVVVNGTDLYNQPISETLPAFTAGSGAAVTGVKAFKTITSIVLPTVGASTTVSVGTGAKLGLPIPISRDRVEAAFLGGVRETTRPTVVANASNISQSTVTLNSALNGATVEVDVYA